jgi:hypothetical protein
MEVVFINSNCEGIFHSMTAAEIHICALASEGDAEFVSRWYDYDHKCHVLIYDHFIAKIYTTDVIDEIE